MHFKSKVSLQAANTGTDSFPDIYPDKQITVQLEHTDSVADPASHYTLPDTLSDTEANTIANTSTKASQSSAHKLPDIRPDQCYPIQFENTNRLAHTVSNSSTHSRPNDGAHCAGDR